MESSAVTNFLFLFLISCTGLCQSITLEELPKLNETEVLTFYTSPENVYYLKPRAEFEYNYVSDDEGETWQKSKMLGRLHFFENGKSIYSEFNSFDIYSIASQDTTFLFNAANFTIYKNYIILIDSNRKPTYSVDYGNSFLPWRSQWII